MCIIDNTISRANSIDLNQPWGTKRQDTCECHLCPCCKKPYSAGHPMPRQPWNYPTTPNSPNRVGPSDWGQRDFPFGDLMGLCIPDDSSHLYTVKTT